MTYIPNPTENVVPVEKDGVFVDSPQTIVYTNGVQTEAVYSVPVTIPSGTLSLGGLLNQDGTILRGVTELKDSGESFLASDNVTGLIHSIPLTLINDDLNAPFGVGRTRVQDGVPFIWSTFGGTDTDTVSIDGDRKVLVTFREVFTAYLTGQRFRGTKGKMHYRIIDTTASDGIDTLVYTSEQGEPIDFDNAVAPDFQIEYETFNPNFLIQDHLLRLEFFSADGEELILKGQATGVIPPTGDIDTFIPFFETKFSTSRERVIFPNDEIQQTSVDFQPDESGILAVDTSSNPVTINIDPAFNKNMTILDASGTFEANNCTVDLQIYNTRNFPNDNIGSTTSDAILADSVDAGASGTKVLLNNSGAPIFYNDGVNWKVVTDSETLDFDEVTNRTGLIFFRLLGDKAALSIGDQTQAIEGISGTSVVFDTIGDAVNPIDSVFHLRAVLDRSFTFDDDIVGSTLVLSENDDKYLFYYDPLTNSWLTYDVRKNLVREAPDDGRSYIRNSKDWLSTEYTQFNDATIYTTSNDFNTLPVNVLDEDVTLEGGVYEITHSFSAWGTATNRSVAVDFRIDDVRVGQYFSKEPKDVKDVGQPCKKISKTLPAGTYNFKTNFGKEGSASASVVSVSDICLTIERKLP